MVTNKGAKFLMAGFFNTTFGYAIGVAGFSLMNGVVWLPLMLVIINVVCISLSFITYKFFVFRTTGNWLSEYMKCYLVYGLSSIMSILVVWYLIEVCGYKFWLAQGFVTLAAVFLSFKLHSHFTFAKKINGEK
jgi:hypothetical protein